MNIYASKPIILNWAWPKNSLLPRKWKSRQKSSSVTAHSHEALQMMSFSWLPFTTFFKTKLVMLWFISELVGLDHGLKCFTEELTEMEKTNEKNTSRTKTAGKVGDYCRRSIVWSSLPANLNTFWLRIGIFTKYILKMINCYSNQWSCHGSLLT